MTQNCLRVAWVTGGGTGIGAALAIRLCEAGWAVAISGRRAEALEAVIARSQSRHRAASRQRRPGGKIIAAPCDITSRPAIDTCLEHITSELGPIDLAVLNAGTHDPIRAAEFDAARVENLLAVNLLGTVNCLDPLLKQMLDRHHGQIAIVSSVAGFRGLPTSSAYGASKAALINMAEALAPELRIAGIKLQVICPGFVKTPLTDKNDFPMPFLMTPEHAARLCHKGLKSRKFEIVFPWQMKLLTKILRFIPARAALFITKHFIPR